jgi:hypothetical protein
MKQQGHLKLLRHDNLSLKALSILNVENFSTLKTRFDSMAQRGATILTGVEFEQLYIA